MKEKYARKWKVLMTSVNILKSWEKSMVFNSPTLSYVNVHK